MARFKPAVNDQTTSTPPDQDATVSAWLARYLADEARAIERLLDAVQKDAAVIDDLLAGLLDSDQHTTPAPIGDLTTP